MSDTLCDEFEAIYPSDAALLTLAENNTEFRLEAIAARHRFAAFEKGYQAGRAAAEADRKDAERYRWLRKDGNGFHFDGNADVGRFEVKQKTEPGTAIYHRGENLDAAIDTARASQEKA